MLMTSVDEPITTGHNVYHCMCTKYQCEVTVYLMDVFTRCIISISSLEFLIAYSRYYKGMIN